MSKIEQPGCKGFATKNAVVFECNLGMKPKIKCVSCGKLANVACDYPLRGKKKGQFCARPLCVRCATIIVDVIETVVPGATHVQKRPGAVHHYCRVHGEMIEREERAKEDEDK